MEEKPTPNSAISFVPGLALSHGVSSPPATVPLEADNRAVNTNNISVDEDSALLSNNVTDDHSNGGEDDGKNLDLLNPFVDADVENAEQISSEPAVGEPQDQQQELNQHQQEPSQQQQEPSQQQQQLTGATDTFSVAQVTGGCVQQFQHLGSLTAQMVSPKAPAAVLDTDLCAALTSLSPDATLPICEHNKELTSLLAGALPESLYDDQCKTGDSIICEGSKNLLTSTTNELLPVGVTTSVSELEDTALCEQGEVLSTNTGTQPQTPSHQQATPSQSDVPALSSAELSLDSTRHKWQRRRGEEGGGEEGGKQAGKHDEFAAVQEMMDLTAADLMMESQLLGGGGDEATVPSCSPAR